MSDVIVLGNGRPDFSHLYKQPEHLCPVCDGRGYTRKTGTVFKAGRTEKQGSGCPECRGTGRVDV